MKSLMQVCIVGSILIVTASAQESRRPPLRKGVSVQMPVADHAVEARAADAQGSIVLAVTADGKLFADGEPTETGALNGLKPRTVYVKADARAPFQTLLTVLDALRGKVVVLLAASPQNLAGPGIVPPYGLKVTVSR